MDVHAHPDRALAELARDSVPSIIPLWALDLSDPEDIRVMGPTLGESRQLCEGERFADDPVAASCSAVLVADNLALTAAHCVPNAVHCQNLAFVFGYHRDDGGELATITWRNVYRCAGLVDWRYDRIGRDVDHALVRLDRPVSPWHRPVQWADTSTIARVSSVAVIGNPSGLPLKISTGPLVGQTERELSTHADTFGGNSGSGVYGHGDDGWQLIGLHHSGTGIDYDIHDGCRKPRDCRASRCLPGYAERIDVIRADFCARHASEALCGTTPECGDGRCAVDEDAERCPADCNFSRCGDGTCQPLELQCPADCDFGPRSAWYCDLDRYDQDARGASSTCDCRCGQPDPDCELPEAPVVGCGPGQTCAADGRCEGGPPLPERWTCEPAWYGDGLRCDCACGAPDPDCVDRVWPRSGCQAGQVCTRGGECADLPGAWSCEPERYSDGFCDCECGHPDPDCFYRTATSADCSLGEHCDAYGECRPVPEQWHCEATYYADGSCHCGCGAPDPDCELAAQPALRCALSEVCSAEGRCEPLPETWTCGAGNYASSDGCHCGCGAPDPDCDAPRRFVLGCAGSETCDAWGRCVQLDAVPSGGGCSVTGPASRPGAPGFAFIAALVVAAGRSIPRPRQSRRERFASTRAETPSQTRSGIPPCRRG